MKQMSSNTPIAWTAQGRDEQWARLKQNGPVWDVVVIGGGITGAGVLREAARLGLKVLLVEQKDFAWGTSSRSSKMVHGGLRYLTQGAIGLTRESVQERQRLLDELPGLVEPLKYVYPFRKGEFPGRRVFNLVMRVYDAFAGRRDFKFFDLHSVLRFFPRIDATGLSGGTQFTDAVTDDTRLVLRVLHEAMDDGAEAINYVKAKSLILKEGRVVGVTVKNKRNKEITDIHAKVVINATGAWADRLRQVVKPEMRIRPLRGSHLVVPSWRLPVHQAITGRHPIDKRAHFIYPWEGRTVIGTTDLDHRDDLDLEASITQEEVDYLLASANAQFPQSKLTEQDVITSWSGVRPIVAEEGSDIYNMKPSQAKRDHVVWNDQGLITVTGGKLTTFRVIALDALHSAESVLGITVDVHDEQSIFDAIETPDKLHTLCHKRLNATQKRRLLGLYGRQANALLEYAHDGECECIPGTFTLWAELRWAVAKEATQHLDDVMLRRTRLGLLLAEGGLLHMPMIRRIMQQELAWGDVRWDVEQARYMRIWHNHYSLPSQAEA